MPQPYPALPCSVNTYLDQKRQAKLCPREKKKERMPGLPCPGSEVGQGAGWRERLLDQAGDFFNRLQAPGDRGLGGRGEEEPGGHGFPADPDALKLRQDLRRHASQLVGTVHCGERETEVEEDQGALVGKILLGISICCPAI